MGATVEASWWDTKGKDQTLWWGMTTSWQELKQ